MFSDAYGDWLTDQWWFWMGLFLVVFAVNLTGHYAVHAWRKRRRQAALRRLHLRLRGASR